MSQEITTAFVKQFEQGVTVLQQQMGSNLRMGVSVASNITGDRDFFDQVSAVEMSQVTNRHGDTPLTDTPHRRRMLTLTPWDIADMVDRPDKVRTLNDPTNSYVQQFAAAAGRRIDQTIIDKFTAAASTGVDGSGSTAFDSGFTIAKTFGADSNLTTAKVVEARRLLEEANNPEDGSENQWFFVAGASQRAALLNDTQFQDSDFNSVKALVHGEVNTWLGFTFIKSELLPLATGNVRSCYAWKKSSMKLGIGSEPRGFIDVRPDKRHGTQVRYELDIGATRMDEEGVVEILCDEDL